MPHTIHPGETLAALLGERGISQVRLAEAIGVPLTRINEIVRGRRAISTDTALRLGRALGPSARYWLALQGAYDIERARESVNFGRIETLVSRSTNKTMMQALEDDMDRRQGVYRRLAAS